MNHLFLAENDFAASGFCFVQALRAVGETADEYIRQRHVYHYIRQGEPFPAGNAEFIERFAGADFIWIVQSDLPVNLGGWWGRQETRESLAARREWMRLMSKKQVVLLHGGGLYRDHRAAIVEMWQTLNPISICYSADLMGGFEREHLILPPVNTEDIVYSDAAPGPLRVGHFPSRPTEKGSAEIVPALSAINGIEFMTSVTDVTREDGCDRVVNGMQLFRMRGCDVIVDQICPTLNGKPFGEWVSLSLEAAALGRVVITNSQRPGAYVCEYGRKPALSLCNTVGEMVTEIEALKRLPRHALRDRQLAARRWIEDVHALVPSGRKLLGILGLQEERRIA